MWTGVVSGFAIKKFSGSVNRFGMNINNDKNSGMTTINPKKSLIE